MTLDHRESSVECLTEQLLHALKAYGARAVFGIPGDYALPMFGVIESSNILPLYTLSHDYFAKDVQLAVWSAYLMMTRKCRPGV